MSIIGFIKADFPAFLEECVEVIGCEKASAQGSLPSSWDLH